MNGALLAAALVALALASGARADTHVVTIRRMAFELPAAGVRVGDAIEWVNADSVPHTATSAAAGFDVALAPGASARIEVTRAGRFDITCRYHPGMQGVLQVR